VLACVAGSARAGEAREAERSGKTEKTEKAEGVDRFGRWLAVDVDAVLCRLKISTAQKERLAGLHGELARQKAEIVARYREVRMAMARRGMYREIMAVESGAEKKFLGVLTADQRRRMAVGDRLLAECQAQVDKVKEALEKRSGWARRNPSGYADFKKRCEAAIRGWVEDRDRKLERYVGKKPVPGSKGNASAKSIKFDEGGVYRNGKWEYRLKVEKKGGKVVYRSGSLIKEGKGQHLVKPGTVLKTPWGKMKKLPCAAEARGDQGWIPVKM